MTQRIVLFLTLTFLFSQLHAQLPATQENKVGFRSELYGGLILHTNGWGMNITKAKFKTYKRYNLYSFDFINIKHPKEYKIRYRLSSGGITKAFKYGKLNSLYAARFSYGQQIVLYEKQRERGVEVYFNWKTGLSLGIVKPIFLEVYPDNNVLLTSEMRYNPEIHNESNIYGKARFGTGFNEITFSPGAHLKGGFKFELSKVREKIFAIETGIIVDIFPTGIPLLAFRDEEVLFYNFYLNILFGKKYYD